MAKGRNIQRENKNQPKGRNQPPKNNNNSSNNNKPGRGLLTKIGNETVDILNQGEYHKKGGITVSIRDVQEFCESGTVLYTPQDFLDNLLENDNIRTQIYETEINVVLASSLEASKKIVTEDQEEDVALLNFASAKNPGGGFLTGAYAQEESIARSSGIYKCIEPQKQYYIENKKDKFCLYTHHMIYSPKVPIFRTDDTELLDNYYLINCITAPAPNRGAAFKRVQNTNIIYDTLYERADRVLAVAAFHQNKVVILGAWGCGVFRNQVHEVSQVFALLLKEKYLGVFKRIEFAIYDEKTYNGFKNSFYEVFN